MKKLIGARVDVKAAERINKAIQTSHTPATLSGLFNVFVINLDRRLSKCSTKDEQHDVLIKALNYEL
jgi:hypothetical protein